MNGLCKVVPHTKEQVRTQSGWRITQHMHSEPEAANVHLDSYGKSVLQTARQRRAHEESLNPVNSQSGRVKTSISARSAANFAYLTALSGYF